MLGPRGYLFHCHGAPLRSVPLPRHIRGQQSADLVHEFFQFPILSEGKAFILLADERQRAVDLRKLLRLKKGVSAAYPARAACCTGRRTWTVFGRRMRCKP